MTEMVPLQINQQMLDNSEFIKTYRKQMVKTILRIDPTLDKKEIKKTVNDMILEQGMSPPVTLDNNYTHEERDTTLISVLDWTFDREPIIAGNATFYKNQHEEHNPAAYMLRNILAKRKAIKKRMFKVEDVTSRLYKDLDRS